MNTQEIMVRAASVYTASVLTLLATGSLLAQDIVFTNRTATFTNLEGRVYTNVTLVKASLDGLIWSGDGRGLISYTNLSPAFLKSLGIPSNRIETAKARAQRKGGADAQYRAAQRLAVPPNTNQLARERLRGLTEFSVRQIENFPERVSWGEGGWMDAVFQCLDARWTPFPEIELCFTVKDKDGAIFRRCEVLKRLDHDINGPPNPLVQTVTALKEGNKVRLIGQMRVPLPAHPGNAWFTVESIEPLQP
jgi:hypothetical protein